MTKRAITYGRVSYDDAKRSDGLNLQAQLDMCRAYCEERGYTIVAELAEDDRGASGADFDLPMLTRALEMARAGEADVLVTRELDRFARGLAKQLVVESELKRARCGVEYVLAEYADTPEGELQKNVRAIIAEYERVKITERMVRGKRNRAKAGNIVTNNAPYGYRVAVVGDKRSLEVYEPEARFVRLIFDWYTDPSEPVGINAITTKLEELGAPTQRGGNWWPGTVHRILACETYIGTWYFGKTRSRKHSPYPKEAWIPVEAPAIVDDESWKNAQAQLRKNKQNAERNLKYSDKYLLRGHVVCARCGAAMLCRHTSKGQFYYYCMVNKGRRTIKRECDSC
jgi:site-specific DNA recombinase